jgi:hypothetical protein
MVDQDFWDTEYARIREIDPVIAQVRAHGAATTI